jgi:hypothetical protein
MEKNERERERERDTRSAKPPLAYSNLGAIFTVGERHACGEGARLLHFLPPSHFPSLEQSGVVPTRAI